MELKFLSVVLVFMLTFQWNALVMAHEIKHNEKPDVFHIYKGCGFLKLCLKICQKTATHIENGCATCIKQRNCPALVTVRHHKGEFTSQLFIQQLSDQNDYIAIGLCGRAKPGMFNSPYVACVHRNTEEEHKMVLFSGFTGQDYYTIHYFDMSNPDDHIFYNKKVQTRDLEGFPRQAFYCEFSWKQNFAIKKMPRKKIFNLSSDMFFIIAATGFAGADSSASWTLGGHYPNENGRVFTSERNILTKVPIGDPDYDEDYDCESSVCRGHMLQAGGLFILSILAKFGLPVD